MNKIENIKNLYESREKVIKLFNGYTRTASKAKHELIYEEELKILTSTEMFQRLPTALA